MLENAAEIETKPASTFGADGATTPEANGATVGLVALKAAELEVRELLGMAQDALHEARDHASEAPEVLAEAERAVADATQALAAIKAAQQQSNAATRATILLRVQALNSIVTHATHAVAEESNGNVSSASKASLKSSQATVSPKAPSLAARMRSAVFGDKEDADGPVSTARRRAAEEDDDDHPARKRGGAKARRTNPGIAGVADWVGDQATDGWTAAAGAMGLTKDSTRRGKTAIRAVTDGAAAIGDGDADAAVNAANRVGVGTERSLTNMGVNRSVAKFVGQSAETVTSNVGVASALTVGAVTGDSKKSSYSLTQLGKALERNTVGLFTDRSFLYQEVRDLMPVLQRTRLVGYKGSDGKALLDKDKDGKVELDDVIALLKKHGLYDLKKLDKDKDGQLEAPEFGAALGHVIARERAAQSKK